MIFFKNLLVLYVDFLKEEFHSKDEFVTLTHAQIDTLDNYAQVVEYATVRYTVHDAANST